MPVSPTETRMSLICRLQDPDDVESWNQFLEMYSTVVRRVARNRGMQSADADNLVQEVMLKVAQSISDWLEREERGRFRPWLVRIAKNAAVDFLRLRASRPWDTMGSEAEYAPYETAQPCEIENQIDLEYDRAVFDWAALQVAESVEPRTWQAFWLTQVEGLSVQEAAEQLGVRAANIYFGRSRVMARLRELVKQFED